ncbi:PucR family transcriptional regulator [Paenibacillus piri]|uniref:PucR family transcriptional regulator n=1 Tax=Paenibacillus piri TaxID=2547395 RepID=A0A4R5KEF4_9BACL|nr:helix-turn-helix domain-containing protein [Paenibacillus piri]TDF92520.1 hypothetical protein E1757_29465 [Paenibacillus piri]
MKLTAQIASPFLNQFSASIDSRTYITDETGLIVASPCPDQHNRVHESAVTALAAGEDRVAPDRLFLLVEHEGHVVGAIGMDGIADNAQLKHQLLRVLKISLEATLGQLAVQAVLNYKQEAVDSFVADLINPYHFDPEKLGKLALSLDINPAQQRTVFLIHIHEIVSQPRTDELKRKAIGKIKLETEQDTIVSFTGERLLFLCAHVKGIHPYAERKLAEQLHCSLALSGLQAYIGIGRREAGMKGLRTSYFQALQSMRLLMKLDKDTRCAHIDDWGLISLIDSIPAELREQFTSHYEFIQHLNPEMEETLEVFLESNLNTKEAADKLHLHRNTLLYRLEKLSETIELDPKKFNDALVYKFLLICKRLKISG